MSTRKLYIGTIVLLCLATFVVAAQAQAQDVPPALLKAFKMPHVAIIMCKRTSERSDKRLDYPYPHHELRCMAGYADEPKPIGGWYTITQEGV
jgi:hypothetical protein